MVGREPKTAKQVPHALQLPDRLSRLDRTALRIGRFVSRVEQERRIVMKGALYRAEPDLEFHEFCGASVAQAPSRTRAGTDGTGMDRFRFAFVVP